MAILQATDRERIERLLSVARATRPLPAGDGSLYFASNRDGHVQVYRQDAPGAEPVNVHASETRMVPHAHTPLGLLVREDAGGNEVWQLGTVRDGDYRRLTHDSKAIHQSVTMHPDGRRAGLGWNPGGQADMVLGEIDLASGEMTRWVQPGGFWLWGAWSPDGNRAAVVKSMGTPTEAYVLGRDGEMTRLLSKSLRVLPVEWLDDGIVVVTDGGRDFFGVAVVDPAQPDVLARWLFDEDHDVEGVAVDPAGKRAALIVNEGVYDSIRVVQLADAGELERLSLPSGLVISDHSGDSDYHVSWSPDGERLFVSWERPTQPAEIYEWPSGTRWTVTGDAPAGLVEPEETSYESFDGLTIPALHYRVADGPRPAMVSFHGGPEGQWRGTFVPAVHLLNTIGMDVFLPNVRGSTGYGLRYQGLDDKTLRWNSVKDGCEAARYLKRSGLATETAAMGGSYGGFMTLAVLVEDPELWDAAVETVGIADWHTFFRNMPPWRGVLRMREYGDPNGSEANFLREISPLHRAGSIRAPLLVIHGRNDPRVPVGESVQISEAVPGAELLIFEDEGHGVAKLPNQVKANRRILEFLTARLS
ncbi:MAG TPA: prolyl oligopeptidase family serine peptidase [Candidatus Dormibacteraeota bacterium]|nr:prolyl oligopeptidase family serine peptidase [Candidatus Dormibacteraeota bacterium]